MILVSINERVRIERERNIKREQELQEKLEAIQNATQKLILESDLSPEELQEMYAIYDEYAPDKELIRGDRFHHEGVLYEVIQAHTSQVDWEPGELPALYKRVLPENVTPIWTQPKGSEDAYMKDDEVEHKGMIYKSTVDNNVWEPGVYGWDEA